MDLKCNICPRMCNVDREKTLGACKMGNTMNISKIMLHHYEEPIISGEDPQKGGSGAIFFSGCSLGCVFCQNSEISGGGNPNFQMTGKDVSPKELSEIFKKLETVGAYNINLVSPTHFTLQIVEALKIYKPKIPIVWNTSGYELESTIKLLDGFVDIFLVDFKYYYEENSQKYSFAKNYPSVCKSALLEMKRQQSKDIIENGLMKKGIIVRHLVLPGLTADSEAVIDFVYKNLGADTIFSLMSQYVPVASAKKFPEINRKIKPIEYKILVSKLKKLGMVNSYVQEFDSQETCFTPNFDGNIFDEI